MNPHTTAAMHYAQAVVGGTVPACKWTIAACQRQLEDLNRPVSADWPWVFNHAKASRVCQFVELLPHIKGKWARERQLIKLEDWQLFILTTVFGWVHHQTGMRRFLEVYEEVPRKNAKSTKVSGVALYMLTADGEQGAECYSAATTRDQARIIFDDAKAMAERCTDLQFHLGLEVMKHSLIVAGSNSKMQPLAAEASTQDGLNIHFAAVDEVHAHKTRALYDVLDTARGAREQSLLWLVTTAGTDRAGICYERRTHLTKVLDRVVQDDRLFGIIYSIDENDDPFDESVWVKANPNYGVSVLPDHLRSAAHKAEIMPSARNNFLTKHLNVWVNGDSPWMDMQAWERCADASLRDLQAYAGRKCFIGLDLAQKRDFAAAVLVFDVDGVWHVIPRLYLNEIAVAESGNAHLSGWSRQGFVQVTDGNITDFDVLADDLRRWCSEFDVQEIAFDPALSMYFAGKLLEEGLPMVEIAQRALFFTPVLLQVENMVLEGKLKHDANPVMSWMISNLVVKISKFNELRSPTKEREENKIDGPMAMLMALGRGLARPAVHCDLDNYLNNMIIA